jgi:lipopolysaccharide transport system permease protein
VAHSLISVALLVVANLVVTGRLSATLVLLPVAYVPLVLLTMALGWLLASLGVYVRDLGPAIGVATQVLFFLSPIFYPVSAVPERFRVIVHVNPLTPILEAFRATILSSAPPAWGPWCLLTLVSGVGAVLGYAWFMQTRKGFADVM